MFVDCTAGITDDGEWIRLFPVPWRLLDIDKRFRKYQYIEAGVIKAISDPRPESYKINLDSINILSDPLQTTNKWEARKAMVYPLRTQSLCALQAARNLNQYPTLGLFKPKTVARLRIERIKNAWTEERIACLRQYSLFGDVPKSELQQIPYEFTYDFVCDDSNCHGHSLSCTDWEMGVSYLKWRGQYDMRWEEKFRDTYETKLVIDKDIHFYVGTLHGHPDAWIIIGLFYPPK